MTQRRAKHLFVSQTSRVICQGSDQVLINKTRATAKRHWCWSVTGKGNKWELAGCSSWEEKEHTALPSTRQAAHGNEPFSSLRRGCRFLGQHSVQESPGMPAWSHIAVFEQQGMDGSNRRSALRQRLRWTVTAWFSRLCPLHSIWKHKAFTWTPGLWVSVTSLYHRIIDTTTCLW